VTEPSNAEVRAWARANGHAIADRGRILGAEHPDTLASSVNLANAYQDAGRWQDTIDLCRPLLAELERILGVTHPNTLRTRGNLANALDEAGRTDAAERVRTRTDGDDGGGEGGLDPSIFTV